MEKKGLIIFIIITLCIFIISVLLISRIFDIQIFQLHSFLYSINFEASKKDYLDLVKKYSLYKELYSKTKSEETLNIEEIKLTYLADLSKKADVVKHTTAALFIINCIRSIMRKERIVLKRAIVQKNCLD